MTAKEWRGDWGNYVPPNMEKKIVARPQKAAIPYEFEIGVSLNALLW